MPSRESLLSLVADYARHALSGDARLVEDLEIDGDDAWYLLERAYSELGADISSIPYRVHFHA